MSINWLCTIVYLDVWNNIWRRKTTTKTKCWKPTLVQWKETESAARLYAALCWKAARSPRIHKWGPMHENSDLTRICVKSWRSMDLTRKSPTHTIAWNYFIKRTAASNMIRVLYIIKCRKNVSLGEGTYIMRTFLIRNDNCWLYV